jgi:hypothetical protein
VADVRAITMTLDGRLALGSVFVQALGLYYGLKSMESAKDIDTMRYGLYGVEDSALGVIGGLLEVWAVVAAARIMAMSGEAAVKASPKLGWLRVGGNLLFAASGFLNAMTSWERAKDADAAGNAEVASLYRQSSFAFTGVLATSSIVGVGAIANILTRNAGQAAARGMLIRVGALEAAEVLGISLTGWGFVLLAAGLFFQVGAAVLTPTPLQKWALQTYFGKDQSNRFHDWKEETEALNKLLDDGQKQAAESVQK